MIKNVFYICSLFFMVFVFIPQAGAGVHDLHMEWTHDTPPDKTLAKFKMYRNGILVHDDIGPDYRALDFLLDIPEAETTSSYTLTAVYTDATETPHSEPYTFTTDSPTGPSTVQGFQIGTL